MNLFFDTETTGKWEFDKGIDYPKQPFPVQLAVLVTDNSDRVVSTSAMLIKQDEWPGYQGVQKIPEETTGIHGITDEMCARYGYSPAFVLEHFTSMLAKADKAIAHNAPFDEGVMNRTAFLFGRELAWPEVYCTMRESTDIVRIPHHKWQGSFKWPKLTEAYRFFTKATLSGAHDALVDCYGCRKVYNGIQALAVERASAALAAETAITAHG